MGTLAGLLQKAKKQTSDERERGNGPEKSERATYSRELNQKQCTRKQQTVTKVRRPVCLRWDIYKKQSVCTKKALNRLLYVY